MRTQKKPSSLQKTQGSFLCRESLWESAHVVLDWALVAEELHVGTVDTDGTSLALLDVLGTVERSETPLLGDNDLLATWELVLRAAESLDGGRSVGVTSADGEENLANVDTGDRAVWLSESTTHSSLESIGSGTRQHLVDTDDVVWVGTDTEMEGFLSGGLDNVFVYANTSSFKGFR